MNTSAILGTRETQCGPCSLTKGFLARELLASNATTALVLCGDRLPETTTQIHTIGVSVPRTTGGPAYRTWNQFQSGTAGQFASRAEAANAWRIYKEANGIVTGSTRSQAVARQYLKSLADDYRTPSWMKPWLREGRRPPGYEIDHIKPLSIGGDDLPSNMRLQGIDLHDTHHRYYRPWEW